MKSTFLHTTALCNALALSGGMLHRDATADGATIDTVVMHRDLDLDRAKINEEARTVPASLSSEIEIERFFGKEVLVHSKGAINMERAADGLPLLFGHNRDQPIGVVTDVKVAGGRLRGLLKFSKNSRAEEVWNDVRDGFLKNISIGYCINKWEEKEDSDIIRVTSWTLMEASVVSVPADHSVGVGRAVPAHVAAAAAGGGVNPHALLTRDDDGGVNVVAFREATTAARREGAADAKKAAQVSIRKVRELFLPFAGRPMFDKVRDELIANVATEDQARDALYDLWADESVPLGEDLVQAEGSANARAEQVHTQRDSQGRRSERITVGAEAIEKFRDGVTEALEIRAEFTIRGRNVDKERVSKVQGSNEFLSMSPVELSREYLRQIGAPTAGLSRDRIVGNALSTRGLISHTTSDFANILEDVSNKSLQIGYNEAPETWQVWARTGSLPDFRPGNRPNLSAFGDLDVITEAGEYKYGSFQDLKEVLQLATYGKLFSISRQALVNDDLDALGRIPSAMGRAAARTVGDLPYNVLINGTTAVLNQDAVALFNAATHGNYVGPGSGAAPSVATIDAARTAMGTQTDPSGQANLNISPAFLIAPRALEGTSKSIQMAEKDPSVASGEAPNFVRNTFETVVDARLDAADPLAWYMAASPSMVETVEVAFLDGQQSPYMETQNAWSSDGVAYKVRIDAVAGPLDFRGLYKNDGN